jgi:hypothetical protein
VAEWFVKLDDRELSFIATPHYFKERNLHPSDEMANHAEHFSAKPSLAFAAERHIGQGKSVSCPEWVVL